MDINTTISTIKDLLNSNIGIAIQFIDFIAFTCLVVRKFWMGIKKSVTIVTEKQNRETIRDILISAVYILIGVIIPSLTIISNWDLPSTGLTLLLEILAWYVLGSFVLFVWVFGSMLRILRTTEIID